MELHYQSYGAGYPLIILHGLFGSLANWTSIGRSLATHYQVVAIDQRNHGDSPHSPELSYTLMADDLAGWMRVRGLADAHLLGHSMGGKTAMQFALRYPDAVDKLIVVDIAPKAYPPHHDEIFDALCELELSAHRSRAELDQALAMRITDQRVRQFLLKNVTRDDDGRFVWKLNLEAIASNYSAISAPLDPEQRFEGPALFVRGASSDYIQPEDEPLIRQMFPAATIQTVPDAGHWVHAEAPQQLIELVRDFLG